MCSFNMYYNLFMAIFGYVQNLCFKVKYPNRRILICYLHVYFVTFVTFFVVIYWLLDELISDNLNIK